MKFFLIFLFGCLFIFMSKTDDACLDLDPLSGYCNICSFEYYYSDGVNDYSFSDVSGFASDLCIIKQNVSLSQEIFVSSEASCENCSGNASDPYSNLFDAFFNIISQFESANISTITIYLMGNNTHYLYNTTNATANFYLFRRKNFNITIKPLECSVYNVSGCFMSSNDKSEIMIKSDNIYFFISNQLTLINLIFNGMDLVFNYNYPLLYLNQTICSESYLEYMDSDPLIQKCLTTNAQFLNNNLNNMLYGFFNIEFPFDCITCPPPLLNLYNCEFNIINSLKGWASLVRILKGAPIFLNITNSTFTKLFFIEGIISILDLEDSYYMYLDLNYWENVLNIQQNQVLNINMQGNIISEFNYFNISFGDLAMEIDIFSFDNTFNNEYYSNLKVLGLNITNELYLSNLYQNGEENLILINGFGNLTYLNISNSFFNSNYLQYILNVLCLSKFLTIHDSIFSNNINSGIVISSQSSFHFSSNLVSNHSLLLGSSFFYLNYTKYFIFDVIFENWISSSDDPSSIFGSLTNLPYSVVAIFYNAYSHNYTFDQIMVSNMTCLNFELTGFIATTTTISNLYISKSNFLSFFMLYPIQSLINCYIENIFILNQTTFENFTATYVLDLGYSRNRTLQDVSYFNSNASFFFCNMMTPYSFHYMQIYLFHLHIENIIVPNNDEIYNLIYFTPTYNVDTSDMIITNSLIRNISFISINPVQSNSLFTLVNIYYMIIKNFTIAEICNASMIDFSSQSDFPFVSVANFTDLNLINKFTSTFYDATFYSIGVIYMKNCSFINKITFNQSISLYFQCFPVCYLALMNCTFSGLNPGGALGLKYQNIKRILIVNTTFVNNGGNFYNAPSFADISLNFMETLADLHQNKENYFLMFENYNVYCLDLQNINQEANETTCLNFTQNFPELILIIGQNCSFFNLIEWDLLFSTYGIQNCSFLNSQSTSIVLSSNIDCVLRNNTFFNISSFYSSSVIFIDQQSSFYSYQNQFINCESNSNGGISQSSQGSTSFLIDNSFVNIISSGQGGVFYLSQANIILLNSHVINSTADQGGVLYSEGGSVNFSNVTTENTVANLQGGCFYMTSTSFYLFDSKITRSLSYHDGGVLLANQLTFLQIIKSTIENSQVLGIGGCYIIGSPNMLILFDGLNCSLNEATNTACVYLWEGQALMNNSIMMNNNAESYLITCLSSFATVYFEMTNCVFSGNNLTNSIISFQQAQIKLSNLTFQNNFFQGSVIEMDFANFSINLLNFSQSLNTTTSSTVNNYILIALFSEGMVTNGLLDANFENIGGISSDNSQIIIQYVNFSRCSGVSGGAFEILDFSTITIWNSFFNDNNAVNGGAIYIMSSFLFCSNNTFLRNSASNQGSDIFISNALISSSVITIENNVFEDFYSISTAIQDVYLLSLSNNIYVQNVKENTNKNQNHYQGLLLLDVANTIINQNSFLNLIGLSAISVTSQIQDFRSFLINSSHFINCSSMNSGGAIYFDGSFNFTLLESEFLSNFAEINGGAISVSCSQTQCFNYQILNNDFFNNSAGYYAGTMKLPDVAMNILNNNIFNGNSAQIGDIISFNPSRMFITVNFTLLNETQNLYKPLNLTSSEILINISSGQIAQIYILILDNLNNFQMFDDSGEVTLQIEITDNSLYLDSKFQVLKLINGQTSVHNGIAFLDSLTIIGQPGQNYTADLLYQNSEISFQQSFILQVILCKVGEIFVNSQCVPCGAGFYSLDQNTYFSKKNSCDLCPPNSVCYGYDHIIPQQGYWRMNDMSYLMILCSNVDNCPDQTLIFLNNEDTYSYQCSLGNYGNLCSNCLEGYGKDSNGICHQCGTDPMIYVRFFVFTFLTLMFLLYQSYAAMEFKEGDLQKRPLLKILINHNYYLSFLQNLKVDWVNNFKTFVSFSDMYGTSVPKDIMNYDCFITYSIPKESIPITKSLGFSLMPIVLFIILVIFRLFVLLIKRILDKNRSKGNKVSKEIYLILGACSLITVYNFYSRLIMNTLQLLKCINLDQSNLTYLELDPNIECWVDGGFHLYIVKTLFLLNFLLWCVGWPLMLFLLLKIRNYSHMRRLVRNLSLSNITMNRSLLVNPVAKPSNFAPKNINNSPKAILPKKILAKEKYPGPKNNENEILNRTNLFKIINASAGSEKLIKPSDESFGTDLLIKKSSEQMIPLPKDSTKKNFIRDSNDLILKRSSDKIFPLPKALAKKDSLMSQGSEKSIDLEIKRQSTVSIVLDSNQKDKIFHGNKLFRFLTIDYKPDYYYWEGFFYISNLIIATLNVTTSRFDSNSQGGIFISIYFAMLYINETIKPFRIEVVNKFNTFSYLTIILTLGLVLMSMSSNTYNFQSTLYFYLMIILNVCFFTAWGVQFGKLVCMENISKLKRFGKLVKQKTGAILKTNENTRPSINNFFSEK